MNLRDQISHDIWEEEDDAMRSRTERSFHIVFWFGSGIAVGFIVVPILVAWFVQ